MPVVIQALWDPSVIPSPHFICIVLFKIIHYILRNPRPKIVVQCPSIFCSLLVIKEWFQLLSFSLKPSIFYFWNKYFCCMKINANFQSMCEYLSVKYLYRIYTTVIIIYCLFIFEGIMTYHTGFVYILEWMEPILTVAWTKFGQFHIPIFHD